MKFFLTVASVVAAAIPVLAEVDFLGYKNNSQNAVGAISDAARLAGDMARLGYSVGARGIYEGTQFTGDVLRSAGGLVAGPGGLVLDQAGRTTQFLGSQAANVTSGIGRVNEQVLTAAGNIAQTTVDNVAQMAVNTLSTVAQLGTQVTEQSLRNAQFIIENQKISGSNLYPVFSRPASRAVIAGTRSVNNVLESIIFNSSLIADRLVRIGVNLSLETIETIIRVGQTPAQIAIGISRELSLYGVAVSVQTLEIIVRESISNIPVAAAHVNQFGNYLGHVVVIVVQPGVCNVILNDRLLSTINYPRFP